MIRKQRFSSYLIYVTIYRKSGEIRKSKLPWKQRNSVDKLKMIRASDEGNFKQYRTMHFNLFFL